MAKGYPHERDWPAEALPIGERIRLLGLKPVYFPEHSLADISRRVQVRDISALAPPREVARYAQAIKNGDKLPPVILTADGYLVDGATRTAGALKAGRNSFPAFEVDVIYDTAPEGMRRQLAILGGSFNNTHGRGMSLANIEALIDQVADEDDSPAEIARKLHISPSTVSAVLSTKKVRSLAEQLGVELDGMSQGHMKILGGKIKKFTQPVWRELLVLTQDAHLSAPALNDLCRRLEDAATESDRLALLVTERNGYREVIHKGVPQTPRHSAKMRRALGYLGDKHNPELFVELNPADAPKHMAVLDYSIEFLQKVRDRQVQLDADRQDAVRPARSIRVPVRPARGR